MTFLEQFALGQECPVNRFADALCFRFLFHTHAGGFFALVWGRMRGPYRLAAGGFERGHAVVTAVEQGDPGRSRN